MESLDPAEAEEVSFVKTEAQVTLVPEAEPCSQNVSEETVDVIQAVSTSSHENIDESRSGEVCVEDFELTNDFKLEFKTEISDLSTKGNSSAAVSEGETSVSESPTRNLQTASREDSKELDSPGTSNKSETQENPEATDQSDKPDIKLQEPPTKQDYNRVPRGMHVSGNVKTNTITISNLVETLFEIPKTLTNLPDDKIAEPKPALNLEDDLIAKQNRESNQEGHELTHNFNETESTLVANDDEFSGESYHRDSSSVVISSSVSSQSGTVVTPRPYKPAEKKENTVNFKEFQSTEHSNIKFEAYTNIWNEKMGNKVTVQPRHPNNQLITNEVSATQKDQPSIMNPTLVQYTEDMLMGFLQPSQPQSESPNAKAKTIRVTDEPDSADSTGSDESNSVSQSSNVVISSNSSASDENESLQPLGSEVMKEIHLTTDPEPSRVACPRPAVGSPNKPSKWKQMKNNIRLSFSSYLNRKPSSSK